MKTLLFILCATSLYADQSIRFTLASPSKTATWLLDSTVRALNDLRIEARIKFTCPATDGIYQGVGLGQYTASFPNLGIAIQRAGAMCYLLPQDFRDTTPSPYASVDLVGRSDILIRMQRDTVGGQLSSTISTTRVGIEMWNALDGGGYLVGPTSGQFGLITTVTSGTANAGDTLILGNGYNVTYDGTFVFEVAWMKVNGTIIPLGGSPPKASDPGTILNYQFEGTGADTSGNSRNLTLNNSPAFFTTTPVVAAIPRTYGAPSWTTWQSVRAGVKGRLDNTQSFTDEINGTLTHQWSQISGPSSLIWNSRTSTTPTIDGHVAGTYVVRDCETSVSGQIGCTDLQYGAVATDANGVVVTANPNADTILGQAVAFGRSPWPYLDDRHKSLADYYGGLLSGAWSPSWRTLQAGTVSVASGSTTLTGVGTSLSSVMTCSAANRDTGDMMAIRYPDASVPSGLRYRIAKLSVCTATTGTLSDAWDGPTVTNGAWAKFTLTDSGLWQGGGDGVNYYDSVLAHYSMYFRSGNTLYRDYARTLAANYIENPILDYYGAHALGGYLYPPPRNLGVYGIMLYALDTGRTEMWDFIYKNIYLNQGDWTGGVGFGYVYSYGTTIPSSGWIGDRDSREEAYATGQLNMLSALYPSGLPNAASRKAALNTFVANMLTNRWAVVKRSDGSQRNYYNNRIQGTATVTAGSPNVTGTNFNSTGCTAPNRVWFVRDWLNADQDTVSYTCTYISPTSITLASNYVGTSGSKNWTAELINGPPTQGFMQGIVGRVMAEIYANTGNTFAKQHVIDTATWNRTNGYRPTSKGLFYLRSAVDCEPNPEANRFCVDQGDNYDPGTREYAAETVGMLARARLLFPADSALATYGDLVLGVLLAYPGYGGPSTSDGYFGPALIIPNGRLAKYNGFYFGFGNMAAMPAARLGGVAAIDNRTVLIGYGAPAGVVSTAILLTSPTGQASSVACAASPCAVTVDWRVGNGLYQIDHTMSNGHTTGSLLPLAVQ